MCRCKKRKDQQVITDVFTGKLISLDACIVVEIMYLWAHGIQTHGSCCGHGDRDGYIWTFEAEKMKEMGYEPHPEYPDRNDTFLPCQTPSVV